MRSLRWRESSPKMKPRSVPMFVVVGVELKYTIDGKQKHIGVNRIDPND